MEKHVKKLNSLVKGYTVADSTTVRRPVATNEVLHDSWLEA